MIIWYNKLYVDEKARRHKRKIIKKINKGKMAFSVYCITLASNEENLFDIISANEFIQPYYKSKEITIIGIAYGLNSAKELVSVIINEIYKRTGGFKVREYFAFNEADW